jgi:hypothetical protein
MNVPNSWDRTPMQEIGKRTAEAGAGLLAAAKAGAVQNEVANQAAHRRRVQDAHNYGRGLLGEEVSSQGGDDVGNIVVTGDLYGDEAVKMLHRINQANKEPEVEMPPTPEPTPEPPREPSLLSQIAPLVLAGVLGGAGGAGIGAAIVLAMMQEPTLPPAVIPPSVSTPGIEYILDLPEAIE